MESEILDKTGLGKRLGVSPETVTKWAREKRIPEIRISPKVRRFDFGEVLAALKVRTAAAKGQVTPSGMAAGDGTAQEGV